MRQRICRVCEEWKYTNYLGHNFVCDDCRDEYEHKHNTSSQHQNQLETYIDISKIKQVMQDVKRGRGKYPDLENIDNKQLMSDKSTAYWEKKLNKAKGDDYDWSQLIQIYRNTAHELIKSSIQSVKSDNYYKQHKEVWEFTLQKARDLIWLMALKNRSNKFPWRKCHINQKNNSAAGITVAAKDHDYICLLYTSDAADD